MADTVDPSSVRYQFMKVADPFSAEALQHGVDPNNPIKDLQVEFKDDQVNEAFKRYILKDFYSIQRVGQIHAKLMEFYRNLSKTQIYKKIDVSFEPTGEQDGLKVVFTPEKKRRISGSFDQQIAKDGAFVQEGKLTIKNIFGLLDQFSVEASKGWGGNIIENYHLKYLLPIFYKDYSMDISLEKSFRDLIPTIREETAQRSIMFSNESGYVKLTDMLKTNFVDLVTHSPQTLEQEIVPVRRLSIKVGRIWNNIYEIKKEYGQRTEVNAELAGWRRDSAFLKMEFNHHNFLNPKATEYKKKLKYINFENYFNAGVTFPLFRSKLRINDRFYTYNLRGYSEVTNLDQNYDRSLHPEAGNLGYERLGDYTGDDIYLKNTFKLNFNNYPYLRQGQLVPFLYYSVGYLSGNVMNRRLDQGRRLNWIDEISRNTRQSAGVGLAKSFGAVKLELLLNLFARGKETDRFARFQLRIAAID